MLNKWLEDLTEPFPSIHFGDGDCTIIPPASIPDPERGLLDHRHHMTVTLEEHFGSRVELQVLEVAHRETDYARRLTLSVDGAGPQAPPRVVMAGIMRFNLELCGAAVRERIVEAKTPLGRILIEHEVLRSVQASLFLKISTASRFGKALGESTAEWAYGRVAVIFCDELPAVELLEVLAPLH